MRTWPAAAATAAFVLLAGCGSAAAPATDAVTFTHPATVTASVSGLRDKALALVWRLVDELRPPPGTRTVHLTKLPPPLTSPPPPVPAGWVQVQRTLEAPAQPESAWAALLARTPLRQSTPANFNPGLIGSASAVLPAPEPGLDVAEFGISLVGLSRQTILIVSPSARGRARLPPRPISVG